MAGHRILIIDGDAASRDSIASTLRKGGHEVLTAVSANEGIVSARRHHPELVLADPMVGDMPAQELAAALRSDPRTADAPLLALGSEPRRARLQSVLKAGFDDYQSKSSGLPAFLSSGITDLLEGDGRKHKPAGLLIAFLSAKGGVGTSSLCANLGASIVENRPQAGVAVVDLVLPMGSLAEIVGYEGQQGLATVANASELTQAFLQENLPWIDGWRFHLLAGSPNPDLAGQLNPLQVRMAVLELRAAYDFVLLDLGRSLSRLSLPLIEQADLIVLTANADRTTVALTRALWDFLRTKGVQAASTYLILNRTVPAEGVNKAGAEKTIGLPIRAALPYLGDYLSQANNAHQPYSVGLRDNTATFIFRQIAEQIVAAAQRVAAH